MTSVLRSQFWDVCSLALAHHTVTLTQVPGFSLALVQIRCHSGPEERGITNLIWPQPPLTALKPRLIQCARHTGTKWLLRGSCLHSLLMFRNRLEKYCKRLWYLCSHKLMSAIFPIPISHHNSWPVLLSPSSLCPPKPVLEKPSC